MALQTIKQRILDQLGDTVSGVMAFSALMIKDWVNLGIRVIVGRTPTEKCKQLYSTVPAKFSPTTGMVLETAKLISVLRDDNDSIPRECTEVLFENSYRIGDVNSLFYPSGAFPKFVIEPQTGGTVKLKVYPVSVSDIATANYVSYPEVDPSSLTALAGFPEELEPFVDLYAVIQGKIRSLGYYRKLVDDEINAISGTTVISNTAFTNQTSVNVVHNQGTYPLVQILDTNGVTIGGEVTHNSVNDFTVAFLFSQSGTIITAVPNSAGGDLDSFVSALPTWSVVSMGSMPTVPTLEADASSPPSALPTAPTIVSDISAFITANALPTPPTIVSDISSFIAANALPTPPTIVSDISVFTGVNALPTAPTIVSDISSFIAANALPTPPTIVSDISSFIAANALPTAPTLEGDASGIVALLGTIPTFDGTTTVTLADINTDRIIHNLNIAADLIWKEEDGTDDMANDVEYFLSENDTEEAREASNGANVSVNIANEELKAELGKLNNWESEYKSKVANFSAQITGWLGRWKTYTDEDKLKLEQFISDLNSWMAHWKAFTEEDKIAIEKYLSDLRVWDTNWKAYGDEDKIAIEKYLADLRVWDTNWKAYNDEDKIAIEKYLADLQNWVAEWRAYGDEDKIAIENYTKLLNAWQIQWNAYGDEDKIAIENYLALLNNWTIQWKSFVEEDTLKISIYRAEVEETIITYRADVENEAQRFGLAVQKARSYLESAKIRLGILGNYSQTLTLLPNEITALQKRFDIGVDSYIRN